MLAVLAAAAPASAAQPDLVVPKAKAFPLAAAGWKTYADITVKNAGSAAAGPSLLSLRLRTGGKSYPLKPTPSAVPRLGAGRTKSLSLTARLPAAIDQGTTFTLVVCADSGHAIRESREANNCRTSGPVSVVGPGSLDLVNEALVRRLITKGQAALYKAKLIAGEALPVRFRTPAQAAESVGHDAIVEVAATFSSLSPADRARVGLYAVPAALRKALDGAGPVPAALRRTRADTSPCAFVSAIDGTVKDMTTYHKFVYEGIEAAGDKAMIWYRKSRPGDAASAAAYAQAITDAWPKLTAQFKAPLSDAGRTCLNAGDGRFDVYVEPNTQNLAQVLPMGIWRPTGGANGGPVEDWGGCTNVPAYMDVRPGQPRFVVAHELMHAIQFAYTYKECSRRNGWWDEGSATWAGDYVYPNDDYEHTRFLKDFDEHAEPVWRATGDYDAWLFWYQLAKSDGVSKLNDVFAALGTQTIRTAVNSAIPGGYAKQVPRYLQWLWNATPVGANGFPVQKTYKGWDRIANRPELSADKALTVGSNGTKTITVPVLRRGEGDYCKDALASGWGFVAVGGCVDGRLGPEAGVYQHFTFPDKNVRDLRFMNGMAGKAGEHVEAWMKLADGKWKVEDWSARETTLCRDRASEDVRELYLVSSNVAVNGDGFPAEDLDHELRVKDVCDLVPHSGTFSGTARFNPPQPPSDIDFTTTFSGHMRLVPTNDPATNGRGLKIVSGSFQITDVSGHVETCTMHSPGGTFTLPASNQADYASMLVFGPTLGAYVAAPFPLAYPPADPLTVPVTYGGGEDCSDDGATIDYSLLGLGGMMASSGAQPIIPDENGVIAATNLEIDNRLTTGWLEHYTFSFAPEP